MSDRLSEHKWRDRLFIVFAPGEDDASLEEQKRLLEKHEPGFEERDLIPKYILGGDSFATILVGKDGTEKARFERPVEAEELFRRIDEMPMRKREARRREEERRA
jgi:hypothetical protein